IHDEVSKISDDRLAAVLLPAVVSVYLTYKWTPCEVRQEIVHSVCINIRPLHYGTRKAVDCGGLTHVAGILTTPPGSSRSAPGHALDVQTCVPSHVKQGNV